MSLMKFVLGALLLTCFGGFAHAADPICNAETKMSKKERKICDAAIERVSKLSNQAVVLSLDFLKKSLAELGSALEDCNSDPEYLSMKEQLAQVEAMLPQVSVEALTDQLNKKGVATAKQLDQASDEFVTELQKLKDQLAELDADEE